MREVGFYWVKIKGGEKTLAYWETESIIPHWTVIGDKYNKVDSDFEKIYEERIGIEDLVKF